MRVALVCRLLRMLSAAMALPAPARVSLAVGLAGLLLVVVNQLTAAAQEPALTRAGVLAALLAVGLMLVAVLWTRAVPEAASRAALVGEEGLQLLPGLSALVREELGWGSQMLLTASPAAVVLVHWRGRTLLRRGLLPAAEADRVSSQPQVLPFQPGPICQRAMERDQPISLVNLSLYPGREEFDALLPGLPAVLVQPLGSEGLVLLGGWSVRCFSRSDLIWTEGWAKRLRAGMAAADQRPDDSPIPGDPPPANAADPG